MVRKLHHQGSAREKKCLPRPSRCHCHKQFRRDAKTVVSTTQRCYHRVSRRVDGYDNCCDTSVILLEPSHDGYDNVMRIAHGQKARLSRSGQRLRQRTFDLIFKVTKPLQPFRQRLNHHGARQGGNLAGLFRGTGKYRCT